MFIRQVTYSKNDPASLAYAAGQGVAIAAGGIKDIKSFLHRNCFYFTYVSDTHPRHNHIRLRPIFRKPARTGYAACRQIRICPCRKTGSQGLCRSSRRRNALDMINILQKRIVPAQTTV
jgi:hypothetical protein